MLYACCTAPVADAEGAGDEANESSDQSSVVTTVESGGFYANVRTPCWEEGGWPAEPNAQALDADACAELWKLSAEMLGAEDEA